MSELSLVINYYRFTYEELKEYLMSLNGIIDVEVLDIDDLLRLNIKYDASIITINIIRLEILAFINSLNTPIIFEFDKHLNNKTAIYDMELTSICCEYCYASSIEELFMLPGVIKVTSNFYQKHFKREYLNDKYHILIYYDPLITNIKILNQIQVEIPM